MLEKLKTVFTSENIGNILDIAKNEIKKVAKEELAGADKREKVSNTVIDEIMKLVKKIDFPGIDKIWDETIKVILKVVIPVLVDTLYKALTDNTLIEA